MNIKKILCPTDFSDASHEALALATSLARDNAARLIICHVFQPSEPLRAMASHSYASVPTSAELAEKLEQTRPLDPSVSYEHRMVQGSPSDDIVALAESEDVDLIVMSTHGYTGIKRVMMGSVAEKVVRTAPCPVLTLRQPSDGSVGATS
jgi:universal stress protein A